PERGGRRAHDRWCGHAGGRAPLHRQRRLRHVRRGAMIRALHRWPGLLALALLTIVSLSGAALSVFPATERIAAPQADQTLAIAALADRIQAIYPVVEQIRGAPSGRITAYWFDRGAPGAAVIDPATGEGVASADPNQTQRWLT